MIGIPTVLLIIGAAIVLASFTQIVNKLMVNEKETDRNGG